MLSLIILYHCACLHVTIVFATLAAVYFIFPKVDYSNESDIQKIGATAYASITIWLIAVKGLGPHEWDVRATVWTETMWRVKIML